jgi:fructokinase
MYYGAVEAGGTKFVCAVSNENFEIIDRMSIPITKRNHSTSAPIFQ